MKTKKKLKAKKTIGVATRQRYQKRRGASRATPKPSKNWKAKTLRTVEAQRRALVYFLANGTVRTPVERHVDERGEFITIENVASFRNPIGSVAVLTRKAGSTFAEHWHKREGHTVHVVSGEVVYREKRGEEVKEIRLTPSSAVFSPPNVPHAFLAVEDAVCVVVANISRTQEEYEADVTRLTGDAKLFSADDVLLATKQAVYIPGPSRSDIVGKTGQLRPETILDGEPVLFTPPPKPALGERVEIPENPQETGVFDIVEPKRSYDVDGEPV